MIKFELTYAEISTIHDALNMLLEEIKNECEAFNKPELYKESVAYKLYNEFRDVIEEIEGDKNER